MWLSKEAWFDLLQENFAEIEIFEIQMQTKGKIIFSFDTFVFTTVGKTHTKNFAGE